MYELRKKDNNGKIKIIKVYDTLDSLFRSTSEYSLQECGFDYDERTDIYGDFCNHSLFEPLNIYESTEYRYIIVNVLKNKILSSDYLVGEYRKWNENRKAKNRKNLERRLAKQRQGRKPSPFNKMCKHMRTTNERRWANANLDEEFAPTTRAKRNAKNLPNTWWDIPSYSQKSWKFQSKRKKQWKPKK